SRLMKDGIGEGFTRSDHDDLMNQLYESYSKVQEIRNISQIVGEDDLSDLDKKYLDFGKNFENRFLSQDSYENRSLEDSLDLGWDILKILPIEEIHRVSKENKEKYLGANYD
ncbi:MAG: V-type ATP synthase subunit B, partial [Anaerococcus obesiensis]